MQYMFVLEASLCPNKSSRVTSLANVNSAGARSSKKNFAEANKVDLN